MCIRDSLKLFSTLLHKGSLEIARKREARETISHPTPPTTPGSRPSLPSAHRIEALCPSCAPVIPSYYLIHCFEAKKPRPPPHSLPCRGSTKSSGSGQTIAMLYVAVVVTLLSASATSGGQDTRGLLGEQAIYACKVISNHADMVFTGLTV